jgi:hypothetical protein
MEKIRSFWKMNEKLQEEEEEKSQHLSDNENFISTTDECSDESGLLGKRKLSHEIEVSSFKN